MRQLQPDEVESSPKLEKVPSSELHLTDGQPIQKPLWFDLNSTLGPKRRTKSTIGLKKVSKSDLTNNNTLNGDLKEKIFYKNQPATTINTKSHSQQEEKQTNQEEVDPLKDVDQGYAWVILGLMFIINASTFGTARAYGLIFEKLARQDIQSRSAAALPFTIMGAVENMGGPLAGYLLARHCSWRVTVFLGSSLISLSHLMAAVFESELGQVLTIGLMAGLGLSLVSISSFQINNAYFVRYRSRAFGLGLTGAVVGTFYISPLSQYMLNYYSTSSCYLTLGLILFPNVPLSLFLRPKAPRVTISTGQKSEASRKPTVFEHFKASSTYVCLCAGADQVVPPKSSSPSLPISLCAVCQASWSGAQMKPAEVATISGDMRRQEKELAGQSQASNIWSCVGLVLKTPLFHLIWPTQLLFCWLNFVFGMILVDFGHDRELEDHQVAHLIPIWAFGQLTGRLGLGSLVDLQFVSYKHMTITCFLAIGAATWSLNNIDLKDHNGLLTSVLIFILSMFIANLYILFNGLIVVYMDKSVTALSIGISSFTGSFLLLPRAAVIGHYRDTSGNYDAMLSLFTWISLFAGLSWLFLPALIKRCQMALEQVQKGPNSTSSYLHDPKQKCSNSQKVAPVDP